MKHPISLIALITLLVACGEPDTVDDPVTVIEPIDETPVIEAPHLLEFSESAQAFSQLAEQQSAAMLKLCSAMNGDIQRFLAQPTDEAQSQAQSSFRQCYQSWVSNRLFYQLPFTLSGSDDFNRLLDLIDTRPFQAGYIGGLPEYPYSGLVHELDIPLTANNLRSQHRLMDEESASVGFPVLEFFLWKTPTEGVWLATNDDADNKVVERRKDYLNEASSLLLTHLTELSTRWQAPDEFSRLPERAQLAYVLRSLQRLMMVELLDRHFEDKAIREPEWHHPAQISGQGRDLISAELSSLVRYLNPQDNPSFSQWLAKQDTADITADGLYTQVTTLQSQIAELPENYPFDTTEENTAWQNSRQQVAQLALNLSRLSDTFQISIVTE
ncbi:imelysin family protein [Reinekea blandensis]|uniref:Imelysin-like domain-containing protein n=1 Tax=Reinekea blandensis MED297 TaxID=314283 RepID=A4BAG2_9GAMM|nr:imelysin family protein [Reinekea blandensis]EAR10918.1 hypothetical protein MED297_10421 [Reinekea sp. MED297] [Reinekea blandensis MED297]